MPRFQGRQADQLREVHFQRGVTESPDGSVLIEVGRTKILCTASVVSKVPFFQQSRKEGWLTAEYAMLPGSVDGRKMREFQRRDGRSIEIQRLIGRALRAVTDLSAFPNFTIHVDCDVLQADGGTRCASITGAAVALQDALRKLSDRNQLSHWPLRDWPAAVSVGLVGGEEFLDLDYSEDAGADMDMNVVATASGKLIEVQASGEGSVFERPAFDRLLGLATQGVQQLTELQQAAVQCELPA